MGRWRAPRPNASPYITEQGYLSLQEEQKSLWLRRRDVVKALAAAAAEGDRSENAEYIYRKKELAGIDRRIRYLQKRLPELNVVRTHPQGDRIFFGAWIELCDADGTVSNYRIVGADETDAADGYISIDSPLAKALLKKQPGDEISLRLPESEMQYEILRVHYDSDKYSDK